MLTDQTVMCNNVHLGYSDLFSMLDCTCFHFPFSNEVSILFTFEIRIKIRQSPVSTQNLVLVQALVIYVNLVHITLIIIINFHGSWVIYWRRSVLFLHESKSLNGIYIQHIVSMYLLLKGTFQHSLSLSLLNN